VKQKVKVVYSEKETVYQYDGDNILLEKQGSTTTATYTYGNALVRKDGATPLFDGLGSERTVTNATGAVQGTLTMTAFGQPVASSGSRTDPYEFGATSGYRSDGDGASELPSGGSDGDGLVKVGCRYYDPATGSFVSRDTDLDQAPYVYCNGDPVNAVDPTGHSDLGYIFGFIAVFLYVVTVVVFAPGAGEVFLGSPVGIVTIAAVNAAGGSAGDHLGEAIDKENAECGDNSVGDVLCGPDMH
jgi:RHS repeat-associated protein